MVTPCPLCHLRRVAVEAERRAQERRTGAAPPMPIFHLSLIGVAAGLEDAELKFKRHIVSMQPVLDKIQV